MARPQLSTPLPATHTSATGMRTKETLTPLMVRMSALLLHMREHKHLNWTRCGAESTHPEPTSHAHAFTTGREPRSTRSALTECGNGHHIDFLLSVERSVHQTCCMDPLMWHMMRHDAQRDTNSPPPQNKYIVEAIQYYGTAVKCQIHIVKHSFCVCRTLLSAACHQNMYHR